MSGARLDLQGHCDPQPDELPEGAVAGVACRPVDDVAGHVELSLFDTQQALQAAYLAELERHGVAPRTNGGFCTAGEISEGAYVPGDEGPALSPERGACYSDSSGAGHYLVTLPPFVLADVTGTGPDAAEVALWTWRGNQDVPGGPTVWRGSGPASPEK